MAPNKEGGDNVHMYGPKEHQDEKQSWIKILRINDPKSGKPFF